MNCILITDKELFDRGLVRFINRLPVYLHGDPVQYHTGNNVYVVPESHASFSWLAAVGAGQHHNFDLGVLERMGWLDPRTA